MDVAALRHKSDSIYSFCLNEKEAEIRLLTKKDDDILKVELIYNDKYSFHECVKSLLMPKICSDDIYDYYVLRIELKDKRFAYVFRITQLDGKQFYFSESGVNESYDIKKGYYDFFQISFANKSDIIPINDKLVNRCFYQIFVDRFYKDNDNNNPRINIRWGDKIDRNTLAGGTLKGIEQKLDYLCSLGIDAIYLTPIFKSYSNHKYDTIDYYTVSRDFGDETSLKSLIEEVHKRGMIILLDGVFNHVSDDFFAFDDAKNNGEKSIYFDWFFIEGNKIDMVRKNYETFASCINLPRLNLNNEQVQDYIIEVGLHYAKLFHIDGFRLDVSDEVPHAFWIRFRRAMQAVNPHFILLGENWHNAHTYLNSGQEFDSIMNYAFTKEVLNYVAYQKYDARTFKNRIISNLFRYKTNVNYNLLNLLSSHDVDRFFNETKHDVDLYLIGYALLYTYIGVPCLYYGDEIGLDGGYDPYNRACFNWDEKTWDKKINENIIKLIHIHNHEMINSLQFKIDEHHGLLRIIRENEKKRIVLYVNLSNRVHNITLNGEILIANNYQFHKLLNKGFIMMKEVKNHEED